VEPESLISIIGVLRSERELEVTSVMRLDTRSQPVGGRRSRMSAMLLDEDGGVIAQAPVHELRSQAADRGCGRDDEDGDSGRFPAIVQALVPDAEKGTALVIRRGDEELWARKATARAPRVRKFAARVRAGAVGLQWEVEAEGEPEIWVQWQAGERGEWRALATGLTGDGAEVPVSLLPPGSCRLRLLAGDGFHTSASKLVSVRVPARSHEVAILTPRDGQTLVAEAPMRVHGAATDPRKPEGQVQEARWLLDRKKVAEGLDAFVTAPAPGRHRLELVVGRGRARSRSGIEFVTVDPTRAARRRSTD
jgi:hypothetical protein